MEACGVWWSHENSGSQLYRVMGLGGQHPLVVQLKCSERKKITILRTSVGHLFHNFKDLFIEWNVLRFMSSGFDGLRFSRGRPWYKDVGTQSAGFWNSLMKGVEARDPDLITQRAHSAVLHDGRMGNWDLKVPDLISKDLWQDLKWVISDILIWLINGQKLRKERYFCLKTTLL